jgi:trimeric autotransporter adhesin
MSSLLQQATRILRGSKNSHRFICFINGKIRTFCTHIDDIDSQVAALFGALNSVTASSQLILAGALLVTALALSQPAYALDPLALPTGYQSVSGNHQFNQANGVLNVSTNAGKSIVNYGSFNIGSQAKVNFNLPSSNSSILNRVVGGGMSEIYGTMTSNGKVFLVNPAGIFFGNGANVSVNGLVASTLGIADHKFLSGLFDFSRTPGSAPGQIKIDPNATINILNGGSASFLASSFNNAGTINAPGGAIQIGVGDRITLGNDLIGINVTEPLKETLDHAAILNAGTLSAAQVKLIASTLKQSVLDTIVNNTGRISANKVIDGEGGVVELIADNGLVNNSGTIDASGTTGGKIVLNGEASQNSGELLAMGTQGVGGDVHVLGDSVSLVDHALVDVSGKTGGGSALIGGDYKGENSLIRNALYTYVDQDVRINARALDTGNGGKVIIWGNEATGYYGTILAQGGLHGGNGGFVETSGKNLLLMDGNVDASALHPDGHGGTWLLDPRDVLITNNTDNVSFTDWLNTRTYAPTSLLWQVSEIKASAINAALNNGTDVTVHTGNYGTQQGDIRVQSNILKSNGNSATLQLLAANDIFIDSTGSIKSTSNSPLNIVLRADHDIFRLLGLDPSDGNGGITLNGDIQVKNGDVTLSGQSITLNKLLKTSGDVSLTAFDGHITQNAATSAISGDNLIADANGTNRIIDLRNADFNTVKLTTDSGKIDYTDTDGVTATVQVSNSNAVANVITKGAGSANNDTAEAHLIIADTNKAKELNYTAKSGDVKMLSNSDSATADKVTMTADNGSILQQGGSIKGDTSVTLKAGGASGVINQTSGSMQGASLSAQATGAGQAVNITNADFTNASITTNNGKIDYNDRDGATVTVNAGTGDATVVTNAVSTTANNGNTEANLVISGSNVARDLSFTARQGNVLLNLGSSAAASRNASLTALAGGITQGGGALSATGALSLSASGNIQQNGGTMTALNASLASSGGGITQTGGSITTTTSLSLSASGNIQQSGGSMSGLSTSLNSTNGTINQSNGTLTGTNALSLNASGSIQQTGGSMTGLSTSLNSTTGAITQTGGTMQGTALTAQTNATNKAISITNADFGSASLTTKNGKIDYSDRDGVSATVKAGTNDANVTTHVAGVMANNNNVESDLIISGASDADDLNFTANSGNITMATGHSATALHDANLNAKAGSILQTGGTLSAANALGLKASGNIQQSGGLMTGLTVKLNSTNGSIGQSAGTMQGGSSVELTTDNGSIQQSGTGSITAPVVKLTATGGGITQTGGSMTGTNTLGLTASGNIQQTGGSMTGNAVSLTSTGGNISQAVGTMQGASLTAQTNAASQAISIANADFASAALTTKNGKIDYSDRDGVSVTVKAGTNNANITTYATGVTANNNAAEADLVITGANEANDLNFTAKQGNITIGNTHSATAANDLTLTANAGGITQTGGTLKGTNALNLKASGNIQQSGGLMTGLTIKLNSTGGAINQSAGTMQGGSSVELKTDNGSIQQSGTGSIASPTVKLTATGGNITQTGGTMQGGSLTAQTTSSGQAINIANADFGAASLTTNNGKIDYKDADGASISVKAGTNTSTVTTFAAGTTADNGVVENHFVISGANQAKDLIFTANQGDILLNGGSSAAASQNATLTANNGGIKQSGGSLSAGSTLKLTSTNGDIQQTGGATSGQTVKLTANNGSIAQTGGDLSGRDLQANTTTAGKSIEIDHADFKTAQLTTNNGGIQYADTDGVSVNANAGLSAASNVSIEAETGGNLNGNGEAGITLTGDNVAHTLSLKTNANTKTLFTLTAGDINQAYGSTITAHDLSVKTNVGNVSLDNSNANDVNTLTATSKSGSVSYQDKNGVTISAANLNSDGNGSRGDLSIQANGSGNIDQTGAIVGVDKLSVETDTGNVTFNHDGNDANDLSASSKKGNVSYHDANSINVAGVNLDNDFSGSQGNLTIQTNGNGHITQSGAIYNVDTLSVTTDTGNATLLHPLNDVRHLIAKSNQGNVSYRDLGDINVKSANLDMDGNEVRGNLSLQTSLAGDITQTGNIEGVNTLKLRTDLGNAYLQHDNNVNNLDAGSNYGTFHFTNAKSFTLTGANMNMNNLLWKGDLNLTAKTGTITQTAAINAGELKVNGNAELTNANNTVDVFSAFGPDSTVSFTDKNGFNLGHSDIGSGGTMNLETVSGHINQDYFYPPISSILRNRNITENGGLTAGTLNLKLGTGSSAHLTDTGNAVSHFSFQGDHSHTELVDSIDLNITSAHDANGTLETTVLGGHNLTQSGAVTVDGLKVTMVDGGDFTLNHSDNDVQSLSANATGSDTANSQGSFVDGHDGFDLKASDMGDGDLSLEARHGGNLTQSGVLHADELKLTMTGGGDADLSTQANRVNVLSANAQNEASESVEHPPFILLKTVNLVEGPPNNEAPPEIPAEIPAVDTTGNTQILFRNDQNLNLAESNLGHGDLGVTLTSGANLAQAHLPTSRDITTTGGVHGNELKVSLINGGSADLTSQINTVSVFSGNASGASNESGPSIIRLSNVGDLNLAHSDVGQGELHISNTGNIDNRNLSGTDRDITANDSTLTGNVIALDAQGNGSIDIHNDINAGSAARLTTSNSYGNIYIHSGATVASKTGKVTLNTDQLFLDGYVQGQRVQIWPWNLNLSMGIAGGPGGLLLSQGLVNHINTDSSLGLNSLMFGHKDYKGTILLGSLDLSKHGRTDAAFNAPRVFDATPNNDNKANLIMANNRNVYFTAGVDEIADWASAPGGVSFGSNASLFADLDVNVSGSGLIHVRLKDFTGIGNSYALITDGGNMAFINAQDQDDSGSLKNLGSALSSRSSSLIINQLKGTTIVLPGNPVDNQPTAFGNARPVQFIPNQSL